MASLTEGVAAGMSGGLLYAAAGAGILRVLLQDARTRGGREDVRSMRRLAPAILACWPLIPPLALALKARRWARTRKAAR
jgi:hypothetical protein